MTETPDRPAMCYLTWSYAAFLSAARAKINRDVEG